MQDVGNGVPIEGGAATHVHRRCLRRFRPSTRRLGPYDQRHSVLLLQVRRVGLHRRGAATLARGARVRGGGESHGSPCARRGGIAQGARAGPR